jgi:site-specific DNA recombinase
MADAAVRRCAIYARKSSEEGLEQDYNSLHAQREAYEAFVRSQAGEGWKLIRTAYDDDGFSTSELSAESVALLAVGYIYGGIWAPPPTGLSPVGTAASFAARAS